MVSAWRSSYRGTSVSDWVRPVDDYDPFPRARHPRTEHRAHAPAAPIAPPPPKAEPRPDFVNAKSWDCGTWSSDGRYFQFRRDSVRND